MPLIFDVKAFFDSVRVPIYHGLSQSQVAGCEAILTEAAQRGLGKPETAYILATVFWESGRTMQPIREAGEGAGHAYGATDPVTKKTYYGRGLVQLTWKENYTKFSKVCGVDLVGNPDLALQFPIALKIVFEGMITGLFTGKNLDDYLTRAVPDYDGARRIINGTDQAKTIASYARQFEAALVPIAETTPATPTPFTSETQPGLLSRFKSYLGY